MQILFVHKSYHTNHDPRVKALKRGSHTVKHIRMTSGTTGKLSEAAVDPVAIGTSRSSKFLQNIMNRFGFRTHELQWAQVYRLWKEMKTFDPDVVIVRDYYVNSAIVLFFGRILGAGGIIQEQSPLRVGSYNYPYTEVFTKKKEIAHSVYNQLSHGPLIRITPIRGHKSDQRSSSQAYYVPFTFDPEKYMRFKEKSHFKQDVINIICVAQYKKRKNILMLLKSIDNLNSNHDMNVEIIGKLSNTYQDYYDLVVDYIDDNGLSNVVELKQNVPWEKVQREYSNHDLFVLPSEREPAAVSPLEAMAAGVPVICSDTNGTKDYIDEGETGYIFRTGSQWDLTHKLELAMENKKQLRLMGRQAYDTARSEFHPNQYRDRMERIIKQEFNIKPSKFDEPAHERRTTNQIWTNQ